jgi:hypothetical protein
VYGRAFANTVLNAYSTLPTAALIHLGKLRLSNDPNFNPSPDNQIADFAGHEAAFSGYTAGGQAFGPTAPVNLPAGGVIAEAVGSFTAAAATPFVTDQVTGWWVDDGTNVIAGERLASGLVISFARPGDNLTLVVGLPMTFGQASA